MPAKRQRSNATSRAALDSKASDKSGGNAFDVLAVAVVCVLVVVAATVGAILANRGAVIGANFPPLQGIWEGRYGVGSVPALAIGLLVVLFGGRVAARVRWAGLCGLVLGVGTAWVMSLALVDGINSGFSNRLESQYEYLSVLPRITSLPDFFATFTDSISAGSPERWPVHVAGHPPLIVAPFELLDRIGLGGGGWAGLLCVLVGASASVAVLVTVRTLVDESAARRIAPFVAVLPIALWIGVSADALITAVSAWAIALLAMACTATGSVRSWLALAAGVLLGVAIYFSYGMVLLLPIAAALVLCRGRTSTASWVTIGAGVVALVVSLLGFSWWEGYQLVVDRYYAGLGGIRSYRYWVWANLAAFSIAIGPAVIVGVRRVVASLDLRTGWSSVRIPANTVPLLVLATLLVVGVATFGGLSKGEVERIWMPFAVVLMLAYVAIPSRVVSVWLTAQVVLALVIQHLVVTSW